MLLSIIVPVYNAERYIIRLLDSVLTAGYYSSLSELVMVDDGSTDSSASLIECWKSEHREVVCNYIFQKNGGVSKARNTGLENCHGDYVWFVDADDMLPEGVLSFIYKILEQKPDFIKGHRLILEESAVSCMAGGFQVLEKTHLSPNAVWGYVVRLKLLRECGIRFDEELMYGEDYLWTYMVSHSSENYVCVSEIYGYRQSIGSLMRGITQEKQLLGARNMIHLAMRYKAFDSTPELRQRIKMSAQGCLLRCVSIKDKSIVAGLISEMKQLCIYPYKPIWRNLVLKNDIKQTILDWVSFMFPCETYFWIVYKLNTLLRKR